VTPKHPPQSPSAEAALLAEPRGWWASLGLALCEVLPVAAAFGVFAHLCLHGLEPELGKRQRLEEMRARLLEDRAELLRRQADLTQLSAAMEDPIYAERIRRLDRARAPQTLPADLDPAALEIVEGKDLYKQSPRPQREPWAMPDSFDRAHLEAQRDSSAGQPQPRSPSGRTGARRVR
jgi:hypothetical protein